MLNPNIRHMSHKVGLSIWHFEWCTKYRYKMMNRFEIKNLVEACIRKSAFEHRIKLRVLSVLPDHVHALVSLPNGMTDCQALAILKGRSSYLIFQKREHIRLRYPQGHFWAPSSYSATVGMNDLESCTTYIQNQESHHNVVFT